MAGTLALATALDLGWPVARPYRGGVQVRLAGPPDSQAQAVPQWGGRAARDRYPDLRGPEGAGGADGHQPHERQVRGCWTTGRGFATSYSHLDSHSVKWGQQVQRGQELGKSGNTGLSTGPHLHYTVRIGSKSVDPQRFEPTLD